MATPRKLRTRMPALDKVKADIAAGMTRLQMAEAYGVTKKSLTGYFTKHKLSTKRSVTYPDDSEIIAALQSGESVASLSDRVGVKRDSMWRRIYDRRLRDLVDPPPPPPEPAGLRPGPAKVINEHGISIPRIPTIHGRFEAFNV